MLYIKEEYDKIMKSLENDDWKSFVQEELSRYKYATRDSNRRRI